MNAEKVWIVRDTETKQLVYSDLSLTNARTKCCELAGDSKGYFTVNNAWNVAFYTRDGEQSPYEILQFSLSPVATRNADTDGDDQDTVWEFGE